MLLSLTVTIKQYTEGKIHEKINHFGRCGAVFISSTGR